MTSKKRDWELCRKILRLTEEMPVDEAFLDILKASELEGFSENQIVYHIYLLHDAELLKVVGDADNRYIYRYPLHLTWAGHEFLEATRDETVWKKTLASVTSIGGGKTLEILMELAFKYLRAELGI